MQQRAAILALLLSFACTTEPSVGSGDTPTVAVSPSPTPLVIEHIRAYVCQALIAAREGLEFGPLGQRSVRDAAANLELASEQWDGSEPKIADELGDLAASLRFSSPIPERLRQLRNVVSEHFPDCVPGSEEPSNEPAEPPDPAPVARTFDDGTWEVGRGIQPGVYRNPDPSPNCYWERMRNFSGGLNSIVANGLATGGPIVVQILKSDKGFSSQGCGEWTSELSRVSASKTRIADGIWIVGVDITPGIYRLANPRLNCYWERMRDFAHGLNSIIANGLPAGGSAIVEIAASDAGFTSTGCGAWTRR